MQENPCGLENIWLEGDFVAKGVAVLLIVMSVASWYVMLLKGLQL